MKRIFIMPLVLFMALVFGGQVTSADSLKQYFVYYDEEKPVSEATLIEKGAQIVYHFDSSPTWLIEMAPNEIQNVKKINGVLSISEDKSFQIQLPKYDLQAADYQPFNDDNSEWLPWNIEVVNPMIAWQNGHTGKDVKVAVIDSGIALNHEDLDVKGGVSFVPNRSSYDDDHGHGTHVAGIIAAKKNGVGIVGIAPDVELYAVKVLNHENSGRLSDIVKGIEWSIQNKMDIINISIYTNNYADNLPLRYAIRQANEAGIVIVGITGNSGEDDGEDTGNFPGNYPEVISTASHDHYYWPSYFSSFGYGTDIAAPGEYIMSTILNNEYTYLQGTSMAAPHVAGTIALLKQKYPTYSNEQLRLALYYHTVRNDNLSWDPYGGVGRLQLDNWNDPIIKPTSVSLNKQSITLHPDEEQQLFATVHPSHASHRYVTWQSSDPEIVTVDKGRIIAKQIGTATIRATTINGLTATIPVTVLNDSTHFTKWPTQTTTDSMKTWTIFFSEQINPQTVTKQNIYVTNSLNTRVPIQLQINENTGGTKLTVTPMIPYHANQQYTLWIKNLQSMKSTPLGSAIQMPFSLIEY